MAASALWTSTSVTTRTRFDKPALLSRLSPFSPRIARCPPSLSPLRIDVRRNYAYAASDIKEDFSSVPIDVMADVKTEKIVVLGGSGFVGSAICKAAVSKGIEVVSLSRSGRPTYSDSWVDQVTWMTGFMQLDPTMRHYVQRHFEM